MQRFLSLSFLAGLLIPTLLLGHTPKHSAFKHRAHGGNPAALAKAAAAIQSDFVGFWEFTRTASDVYGTSSDTIQVWYSGDGKTEWRNSIASVDSAYPDEIIKEGMIMTGDWKTEGADLQITATTCEAYSSYFGTEDCLDPEYPGDTTALADYTIMDINGKKAMVYTYNDPDLEDDTLYYVGASAAFTINPIPAVSVRPRVARGSQRMQAIMTLRLGQSGARREGLQDIRGRSLPAGAFGQGIYLRRP